MMRLFRPLKGTAFYMIGGIILAVFFVSLAFALMQSKQDHLLNSFFDEGVFLEEKAYASIDFVKSLQKSMGSKPSQWSKKEKDAALSFEKMSDRDREQVFKSELTARELLKRKEELQNFADLRDARIVTNEKKASLPMFASSSSKSLLALEKKQLEALLFELKLKEDGGYQVLFKSPAVMIGLGLIGFLSLWAFFWKDQYYGLHEISLASGAFPNIFMKKVGCWLLVMIFSMGFLVAIEYFTVIKSIGLEDLRLQEIAGQLETPLALSGVYALLLLRFIQFLEILFLGLLLLNLSQCIPWEKAWLLLAGMIFLGAIPYYLLPIKSGLAVLKYFGSIAVLTTPRHWHNNLPFLGRWYGFSSFFVVSKGLLVLLLIVLGQFIYTKRVSLSIPRFMTIRRPSLHFKTLLGGIAKRWLIPGGGLVLCILVLLFWGYDSLNAKRYVSKDDFGLDAYYNQYMGLPAGEVRKIVEEDRIEAEKIYRKIAALQDRMDQESLEERIELRKQALQYDGLLEFIRELDELAQREEKVINVEGWKRFLGDKSDWQEERAYVFVQLAVVLLIGLGFMRELRKENLSFKQSMVAYEKWKRKLQFWGFFLVFMLVVLGEYGKYLRLEGRYPMMGFGVSSMYSAHAPYFLPLWGYLLFHIFIKTLWFGFVCRVMMKLAMTYGGYSSLMFGGFLLMIPYFGGNLLDPLIKANHSFYLRCGLMIALLLLHLGGLFWKGRRA